MAINILYIKRLSQDQIQYSISTVDDTFQTHIKELEKLYGYWAYFSAASLKIGEATRLNLDSIIKLD